MIMTLAKYRKKTTLFENKGVRKKEIRNVALMVKKALKNI